MTDRKPDPAPYYRPLPNRRLDALLHRHYERQHTDKGQSYMCRHRLWCWIAARGAS